MKYCTPFLHISFFFQLLNLFTVNSDELTDVIQSHSLALSHSHSVPSPCLSPCESASAHRFVSVYLLTVLTCSRLIFNLTSYWSSGASTNKCRDTPSYTGFHGCVCPCRCLWLPQLLSLIVIFLSRSCLTYEIIISTQAPVMNVSSGLYRDICGYRIIIFL